MTRFAEHPSAEVGRSTPDDWRGEMTLGSLSPLFVLRMIDAIGPLSEDELRRRTEAANIELDFGYQIPLSQCLASLAEDQLIRAAGESTYELTNLGRSILTQVVDSRIDAALELVTH